MRDRRYVFDHADLKPGGLEARIAASWPAPGPSIDSTLFMPCSIAAFAAVSAASAPRTAGLSEPRNPSSRRSPRKRRSPAYR